VTWPDLLIITCNVGMHDMSCGTVEASQLLLAHRPKGVTLS
jgi:hypothetical protein